MAAKAKVPAAEAKKRAKKKVQPVVPMEEPLPSAVKEPEPEPVPDLPAIRKPVREDGKIWVVLDPARGGRSFSVGSKRFQLKGGVPQLVPEEVWKFARGAYGDVHLAAPEKAKESTGALTTDKLGNATIGGKAAAVRQNKPSPEAAKPEILDTHYRPPVEDAELDDD